MPQDLPSPELLRKLLRYEPETGKLFWRNRDPLDLNTTDVRGDGWAANSWNARYANKEAFLTKTSDGYFHGKVCLRQIKAHRVIWCIQNGKWPVGEIDHIDGNKANNKIENLRDVTKSQNQRNRGSVKGSLSIYCGVTKKSEAKWCAKISVNKKQIHIGYFDTEEDAARAYDEHALMYHGPYAKTNFAYNPAEVAAIIKKAGEDRG